MELMHRSNEDFYGNLKFFAAHFDHGDVYCFPLDKYGYDKRYTLAFKVVPPYSSDRLLGQVQEYLYKLFSLK